MSTTYANEQVIRRANMAHEINDEIQFSDMIEANNRKKVYLNVGSEKGFVVKTPIMNSKYGLSPPYQQNFYSDGRYEIKMSMHKDDNDNAAFTDLLYSFEDKLVQTASTHSAQWFNKSMTSDEIRVQKFQSCLKYDKSDVNKVSPLFKATTKFEDGKFNCTFVDHENKVITDNFENHFRGTIQAQAIVKCSIYFMGEKFGCTWYIDKIMLHGKKQLGSNIDFSEYAFDQVPDTIDVSNVRFSAVKTTKAETKVAYVEGKDGESLFIKTPVMLTFGGVSPKPEKYADPNRPDYSVTFLMKGFNDSQSETFKFHNILNELDERALEEAKNNPLEWCKKAKVSVDVLREGGQYNTILKHRIDQDTGLVVEGSSPTFKAKIPFYDGAFNCVVFDENNNKYTTELDKVAGGRNINCQAIVHVKQVWFINKGAAGNSFGYTIHVKQLQFYEDSGMYSSNVIYGFRDTLPNDESQQSPPMIQNSDDAEKMNDSTEDCDVVVSDDEVVDSDME